MRDIKNAVPSATRSLNIEEWHRLGREGNVLPVTITLEGDSMRPLIRRGRDKVTIVPLMRELKIGDVVLFKGGEKRYVVHRVRGIDANGWVCTLGDNCWNDDGWMPSELIWGLVVRMERGGRTYTLDSDAARRWGRVWMRIHPMRMFYRRWRGRAAKVVKKILGMKK